MRRVDVFVDPPFLDDLASLVEFANGCSLRHSSRSPLLQARLKLLIRRTWPYVKRIAHKGVWVLFGDPKVAAMKVVGI